MVNKLVNKNVSVRFLVEQLLRRGDLTLMYDIAPRSSQIFGGRTHQDIQNSRPDPYLTEIPVSHRISNGRIEIDIQGRIDGLYEHEGTVVIEEIKTTHRDLDSFIEENKSLHWAQVKVYAAIYSMEQGLDRVRTQLTYGQSQTGEVRTFFQECSADELRVFFAGVAGPYLAWMDKIAACRTGRSRAVLEAGFPYENLRRGQRRIVEDVASVIEEEEQIIIQAPTGTGKTVAVLYPAIQALANEKIQKIFYLTSRTTGRLIAERTLEKLNELGMRVKFVSLTAKEKICFNPERNCTGEECEFARGYYDRIAKARDSLLSEDGFTAEKIVEIAEEHRICPFEFSLDLALWVDCIICDMNYVFDPRVYLKRFFLESSTTCTFLIDEAHNLVDRSREMFSAEIQKSDFPKLRRLVKSTSKEVYDICCGIETGWNEMVGELKQEGLMWQKERPEDLLPLLRRLITSLERWLFSNRDSPLAKQILDYYFSAGWFLRVSEMYDENYVSCFKRENRSLSLKLFCIDPSGKLHEALERANSAVLFSATITPTAYFAKVLGCRSTVGQSVLPSPFPQENLCLLVSDAVSTLYRNREKTIGELVRAIGEFIEAKKGNYMVYFPSYEYLRMALPLYEALFSSNRLLVQDQAMKEEERKNFLEFFQEENDHTLVGFVVMGGIFGEGVDLAGDRLTGAVIVGVGLPGITQERELIRYCFSEQQMPGFDYAYRYPGMIRVLQAAGRVIRTENDRGSVLLIDTRYGRSEYRSLFPKEWQVRWVNGNDQMREVLDDFWAGDPA